MATKAINWKTVKPGRWFRAKIDGIPVTGRIQKEEGYIYLCQNEQDGSSCSDMLGMQYSWVIGTGKPKDLKESQVSNLKLLAKKPKGVVFELLIGGKPVQFNKGSIKIGCTTVSNKTVTEVYKKLKK